MKLVVLLIGGPDVNSRIPLIKTIAHTWGTYIATAGSKKALADEFRRVGCDYFAYPLHRGVNPVADSLTLMSLMRLFIGTGVDIGGNYPL